MSNRTIGISDSLYEYLLNHSLREHDVLKALREETAKLDMSIMQIAPEQGQFMQLLVSMIGAKRTIEVGVFTGYSALCTALALPDNGQVIACDVNEEWTDLAKSYWKQAGMIHKIDLRLAPAIETLQSLIDDNQSDTFDFAFIDADKTSYDQYYELCLKLIRPGGIIAIDNVLWGGSVADTKDQSDDTKAIRDLNKKLVTDNRVDISMLPIADGLSLIRKN